MSLQIKSTSDTKITALKTANESPHFLHTLTDIVNTSFIDGVFPNQLKLAKVVPIHKGNSKTDVSNYRPISLLSSFSKIFEKVMHIRLTKFLESNNSLHELQYGFRSGRSCEHALLMAQNNILTALSKKQISMLLLIDFSKAFDMISHETLLRKLSHYGIRGNAHNWLTSYLTNREQYVSINGCNSSKTILKYGVPQGSILAPLLFVIYVNDMPEINRLAKFILYADDANILITGKTMSEIETKYYEIIKALENWVASNGLVLNIKKTNYMLFSTSKIAETFVPTISKKPIERKHASRFLGVLIDENLTWKEHISAIKMKMSRYIGVLYSLKQSLPVTARLNLYHSFIQSHLNYCSLVWGFGCKSTIEPLFAAQKKGMRSIMPGNIVYRYQEGVAPTHTKPAFTEFKILTVQNII